jgi:SOS-response transcriptional repressor LexA
VTVTGPGDAQFVTGFIHIPEEVADRHPKVYAHRVRGDSMTGDDISDGDYVLVDPDIEPGDGDIAIVWVTNWRNSETGRLCKGRMVKRLARNRTVLESSNPAYRPMTLLPEHQAKFEGAVVGRIHNFEGELKWRPTFPHQG